MALQPISLRFEAPDGKVLEEYRVRDHEIEVRQLQAAPEEEGGEWHRLSPEELSGHVYRNSVVAQWLKHRLGRVRLLRACVAEPNWINGDGGTVGDRRAA